MFKDIFLSILSDKKKYEKKMFLKMCSKKNYFLEQICDILRYFQNIMSNMKNILRIFTLQE